MSIESIELWHKRARPTPREIHFNVQLGCHFEEICEMLAVLNTTQNDTLVRARAALSWLADGLKQGRIGAEITDRKEFLDSLADQVVTAIGVGHTAGMQTAKAVDAVNQSNWSKMVDGEFVVDANGKIIKPESYRPPNLEGLY